MAMYNYSISGDTLNGIVAASSLIVAIQTSEIITAFDKVDIAGDAINIYMKDSLSVGDEAILDAIVSSHDGVPVVEEQTQTVEIKTLTPFASKTIIVGGVEKRLYKRVHGVGSTIQAGQTSSIDFVVPYSQAKFTGANIFGSEIKDTLNFYILDTANNDYSGAPTSPEPTYYPNFKLNQFGFDVELPTGAYENTSNYEADLYVGMIIRCEYTNNGLVEKYVSMNVWLHEVV